LELTTEKEYRLTEHSAAFPGVRFSGVERLLQRAVITGELEWQTVLEKWVRNAIVG
jgi:hypothetical protein